MALDALWALLTPEVSQVSGVQAPIYAGLRDTPAVLPEVSRVSGNDSGDTVETLPGGIDTPETPLKSVRYQRKAFIHAGCTLDTPATPEKTNTEADGANELLMGGNLTAPPEPRRIFRQIGPWLNPAVQQAARAYHAHHFKCHPCQAGGQGRGRRCAVGLALWIDYSGAGDITTDRGQHGQA